MSIKAKRKTIIRIIGAFFILAGLILSIIFNYFLNFSSIITLLIIIPWFLLSIFLKLEFSWFGNNKYIIMIILSIYSIGFGTLILIMNPLNFLKYIFILVSILALLICWHFSLSIYRNEKVYFVLGGAIYISISIFLLLRMLFLYYIETIVEIIMVSFGLTTILLIEYLLHRKGYLNYIKK
jgi:hypothetical protein